MSTQTFNPVTVGIGIAIAVVFYFVVFKLISRLFDKLENSSGKNKFEEQLTKKLLEDEEKNEKETEKNEDDKEEQNDESENGNDM